MNLFHEVSRLCSKATTEKYSTSFSSAIKLLHPDLRTPIYNIYGFVRFADEIVDTFHEYDKTTLLAEFKQNAYDQACRFDIKNIIPVYEKLYSRFCTMECGKG